MSSFEFNKIFAAVLCVGILIMLVDFFTRPLFVAEPLTQDAVAIEGASEDAGHSSEPAKPKLPDPIMALLADADIAKGAKISKACAACHAFEKGGPVKQGPALWGTVGAKMASQSGFAYSDAMTQHGGSWDYDTLNKFLAKPKKFIKGTKMNFAGLKKAKDRADLIAWLRQQADSPYPLPSAADIAAEQAAFAPPEEEAVTEEAPSEDGEQPEPAAEKGDH